MKKPSKKKKSKFRCCCLGCLTMIIISLFLVGYTVSASGLVNIPLLSPIFFGDGPTSTREVEPESNVENVVEQRIAKSIIGGSNRLALTEEELTGLVAKEKNLKDGNVMIEEGQLEAFGKVNIPNYNNLYLTISISPEIVDQKLILNIKQLKIGKLRLPAFAADYIINKVLETQLREMDNVVKNIDQIDLVDNSLVIKGDLKKLFIPPNQRDQLDQELPETVDPEDLRSISPPGEN